MAESTALGAGENAGCDAAAWRQLALVTPTMANKYLDIVEHTQRRVVKRPIGSIGFCLIAHQATCARSVHLAMSLCWCIAREPKASP